MKKEEIKTIVLAYSGGLDTSIIIPWLKENYNGAKIIGVCTDVGQKEDWDAMKEKAKKSGAAKLYIKDIKEEFAKEYLFKMARAGALYENKYFLGTSIARPLQAKHIAEIALKEGAQAICHGCTGKGNDQIRFELTFKAIAPELEIIAPWRIWDIQSREDAIDYAKAHNVPLGKITKKNIYSRDENMWHISHEGADLEDPWNRPKDDLFQLTLSPKKAPDKECEITIDFEKGFPVALNGKQMKAHELMFELNKYGRENAIGRADLVESRTVGMKSRGVYETPGGTILYNAINELQMLTMDSETLSLKNQLSIRYAELLYTGKWFSAAREAIDAFMESANRYTTGSVKVVLYKGNIIIAGRKSPYSLYNEDLASFGASSYDHKDASGFINLFGLSTGVAALARKEKKAKTQTKKSSK